MQKLLFSSTLWKINNIDFHGICCFLICFYKFHTNSAPKTNIIKVLSSMIYSHGLLVVIGVAVCVVNVTVAFLVIVGIVAVTTVGALVVESLRVFDAISDVCILLFTYPDGTVSSSYTKVVDDDDCVGNALAIFTISVFIVIISIVPVMFDICILLRSVAFVWIKGNNTDDDNDGE